MIIVKTLLAMLASILTNKEKKYVFIVVVFAFFISIIEVVGISAIMPFLSVAIDFNTATNNPYFAFFYHLFAFKSQANFVIAFGIILILFYLFRFAINILYIYVLASFVRNLHHSIVNKLFKKYLHTSYIEFSKKNSANLNKTLITESEYLLGIINASLSMFSEILVMLMLYGLMFYVNFKITIVLTILLVLMSLFILKIIAKKIKQQGQRRQFSQKEFYEIANQTFGNFKLLKLRPNSQDIKDVFAGASRQYNRAYIIHTTLNVVPRFFLESIGFSVIIAIIIYLIWQNPSGVSYILPTLSIFVLSLYRMLPSVNRIITAINSIAFHYEALSIIYHNLLLTVENLGDKPITFGQSIALNDLSFGYHKNKPLFKSLYLNIQKGTKVAFVGPSGEGKSTLIDLIIGLYEPDEGEILVDGVVLDNDNKKQWRGKVGYIPQHIYLFDGTVSQNVAISSNYDINRIDECLKIANIYDFLQTKEGRDTYVGEGGIRLSGGQKQRIAIARALYHNPEILVLDEATSALDNEVEQKIMTEIYRISQNKTLIIVAHRLSTTAQCDIIYRVKNGEVLKK